MFHSGHLMYVMLILECILRNKNVDAPLSANAYFVLFLQKPQTVTLLPTICFFFSNRSTPEYRSPQKSPKKKKNELIASSHKCNSKTIGTSWPLKVSSVCVCVCVRACVRFNLEINMSCLFIKKLSNLFVPFSVCVPNSCCHVILPFSPKLISNKYIET